MTPTSPAPPEAAGTSLPLGERLGRAGALVVAALAAVFFVLGTVGPPAFGDGVFLSSDLIYIGYPWRADADPFVDLGASRHGPTSDTVDAVYPARAVFGDALGDRDFAEWNQWIGGGEPLGATNGAGQLNPLALPFALAPSWYAPALTKLCGLAVAVGFTYLFCRRVGAGRVPSVIGGMVFAGSGFMVMWTNWPQVDVAAFIPALFWATERFLQKRTASSAVPVALALAAMLLGNFPAVVGYALYVLAPYVLVRLLASRREPILARLKAALGSGAAIAAGVLLTAAVLIPFATRLASSELSRDQTEHSNLGIPTLVTAVAPEAFGLSTFDNNYAGPARNQVESVSYVGVAAILLAWAGLALPTTRRAPPGSRAALAGATIVLGIATYAGGPILATLQSLPVFTDNYIGRTRSVLGFLVASLAALGLQALLERRAPRPAAATAARPAAPMITFDTGATPAVRDRDDAPRRFQLVDHVRFGVVTAAFVALVALVAVRAGTWATDHDIEARYDPAVRHALGFGLLSIAAGALVVAFRAWPRWVGAAVLAAVVAIPAVEFAGPLMPQEDRATLYPETDGTRFLAENVGNDRILAEGHTFYGNTSMLYGVRSVGGHVFFAPTWKEMLRKADPNAFDNSPTLVHLAGDPATAASPVYDRMGVRWLAGIPNREPFGPRETYTLDQARCDVEPEGPRSRAAAPPSSAGGVVTRFTVDGEEGLRGVVLRLCDDAQLGDDASFQVTATAGDVTATGSQPMDREVVARDIVLPVAGDDLAGNGRIEVMVTLHNAPTSALDLAIAPSTGEVAADLVRPGDDGMRLAYADELRIYERLDALPRIRWAGTGAVVEDEDRRLALLASGTVPSDTVVLSEGEDGGSGDDGRVEVVNDGDFIRLDVRAEGDGYVVVADAIQDDWVATVDGEPADVVPADHAGVAVAVPEGDHQVELQYRPRGQRAGVLLSGATATGLAAVGAASLALQRRRRRPGTGTGSDTDTDTDTDTGTDAGAGTDAETDARPEGAEGTPPAPAAAPDGDAEADAEPDGIPPAPVVTPGAPADASAPEPPPQSPAGDPAPPAPVRSDLTPTPEGREPR
jgi:hypothetical protein